jgi:VWFA-related protein
MGIRLAFTNGWVAACGVVRAICAMVGAILIVTGCSSTTSSSNQQTIISGSPQGSIGAVSSTVEPPVLDLCPLPALAPADLRTKPGYTEFAVSALDANGAPITGLRQSDFVIRDESRSYPIAYFHETTSATPTSFFIVGDASSTLYNKTVVRSGDLAKVRQQIESAVNAIGPCNEAGIVMAGGNYVPGFTPEAYGLPPSLSDVTLVLPFTSDREALLAPLENIWPTGPDHLPQAVQVALLQLNGAHYPNRALVIMTDGLDPTAMEQAAPALEQAYAKGIGVWIIGSGDPDATSGRFASLTGTSRVDAEAVKRLAAAAHGEVLFALPNDADGGTSMARAIKTIGAQLGQGYAIGVIVPSQAKPVVALAKPSGEILRTAMVPPQVLADAAARHPRPPAPRCVASAGAAPPAAISSKPGYTQVRVSVLDPDGKAVRDLKQSDFTVASESSQFPVLYTHEDQTGMPRSLIIAIDTSGSMQPKLANVRRELGKLLNGLNPCDEVALIAFSSKPFLLQAFTTDHQLFERRLSLLHSYGPTALYDAVATSAALLARGKYQDRTLILITDGIDNVSKTSRGEAVDSVARNHVQVYAIGIGDPNGPPQLMMGPFALGGDPGAVDKETLEAIALHTGGKDFIVAPMSKDNGHEFANAIASLSEQLDHGYELGFLASPPDATATVTIVGQSDDVVRIVGAASASASIEPATGSP